MDRNMKRFFDRMEIKKSHCVGSKIQTNLLNLSDVTGTWSDREIRTLLTRIHNLPLSLNDINAFEKNISDCERNLTDYGIELPIPDKISNAYERYYDSKLPLVTEYLIVHCPPIVSFLQSSLGQSTKYKHKVMEDGEKYAAFRPITSNIR